MPAAIRVGQGFIWGSVARGPAPRATFERPLSVCSVHSVVLSFIRYADQEPSFLIRVRIFGVDRLPTLYASAGSLPAPHWSRPTTSGVLEERGEGGVEAAVELGEARRVDRQGLGIEPGRGQVERATHLDLQPGAGL